MFNFLIFNNLSIKFCSFLFVKKYVEIGNKKNGLT